MSSFTRTIQRKCARNRKDYEPASQQHRDLPCGGYLALHPTRGWRKFSGRRLLAIFKLNEMRETIAMRKGNVA